MTKLIFHPLGMSPEEVEKKYVEDYAYFLDRARRTLPSPADLLWRIDKVEALYAKVRDAKSKEPLFNSGAWAEWKNFRKHVAKGCLSDHPDIPLYFEIP